jgi:hypothetical protein
LDDEDDEFDLVLVHSDSNSFSYWWRLPIGVGHQTAKRLNINTMNFVVFILEL